LSVVILLGKGFFIIASGKAEVVREKSDGSKVVVNSFGPGDFFGEMALLDEGLRTASVNTLEDTRCLILTSWDFLAIVREDAEMAVDILQELARRFRMALDSL
jgi:CRP-like cAMP-binding protein